MEERPPENDIALPDPNSHLEVIYRFFDAHPELMTPVYLNNFHLLVPGGDMRRTFSENPKLYARKKPLYDDFDAALAEAGIDINEVERIAGEINLASRNKDIGSFSRLVSEMHALTLPAYGLLRKKGYSTADLIG